MKAFCSFVLASITTILSISTHASMSCDCSRLLEQCGANIKTAGSDIQIMTNTKRCAQVTWYADDVAHNTVVLNGNNSQSASYKTKPFLSIGSCNICAKTHPQSAANTVVAAETAECKKRKKNLQLSEKYYAQGRITPYEYELSKSLVEKHCK